MREHTILPFPAKQTGVAILAITIILLLVATIGTLLIGRVGLEEQRVVGADVRTKEVYSAATGGLEYAIKWFSWEKESTDDDGELVYTPNYQILAFNQSCAPHPGSDCADLVTADVPDALVGGSNSYPQAIKYRLISEPPDPIVVRAYALAAASADSHVQKTVSVDLLVGDLGGGPFKGGDSTFDGPPILVEGCMAGVSGTPDVIVYDDGDESTPTPIGIATVTGTLDGSCIDEGHANQYVCPSSGCPMQNGVEGNGKVRTNGNGAAPDVETVLGRADPPSSSLFAAIFDWDPNGPETEREFIERLAELAPDRIVVIDTDGELSAFVTAQGGVDSVGSEADPVIMYFGSSYCPKLNGGYNIWGVVYFADETCDQNGWGNVTIWGTMAKAGDVTKLTANTQFINVGALNFNFGPTIENDQIAPGLSELVVSVIPGTWRDF